MQHQLQPLGGGRRGVPPLGQSPACAGLRHRALMLIGPRGPDRMAGPLGLRVLDRLLAPSAQVEGVDLHLADPALAGRAQWAVAFALVLPPLGNLSNAFYRVHPRRNDRFLAARAPLKALFPEVDFAAFAFTGHALGSLASTCPERFALVRHGLVEAWVPRMRLLLAVLPPRGALIDLPTPEWLRRPVTMREGLRQIALDPGDRAEGLARLRAALLQGPL
ncbi:DUF6473 family protein [Pararhodobacter sp.]|uniref:DUF6473 family protein n=1 Tax=Pararhodobacter sp. TaxID=2127056 RepID=UPI002FE07883|nr:DUF6473 family protein [Pseudomonadota bacterium]